MTYNEHDSNVTRTKSFKNTFSNNNNLKDPLFEELKGIIGINNDEFAFNYAE